MIEHRLKSYDHSTVLTCSIEHDESGVLARVW